jgi:hypothetical protein
MSRLVVWLTFVLGALPVVFLIAALVGYRGLGEPGLALVLLYGWVWARMRPSRFVVYDDRIEVIWPLKRRTIRRDSIVQVAVVDPSGLRDLVGWGMRMGLGGLWGAFGWLITTRRGVVRMYVSRTDGFVWINCGRQRPWLITPAHPTRFVAALSTTA